MTETGEGAVDKKTDDLTMMERTRCEAEERKKERERERMRVRVARESRSITTRRGYSY